METQEACREDPREALIHRLALLLIPLVLACENPVSIQNLDWRTPEEIHRAVFSETVECTGISRPFNSIQKWGVADEISGVTVTGEVEEDARGVYNTEHETIILRRDKWRDPETIAHEVIHHLLRGGFDHPEEYFHCEYEVSNT